MSNDVAKLRIDLIALAPSHDTPIGLVHPYWARKPLNIINSIITRLTNPGDSVLDPFMGSGTVIISALHNNRSAYGSDLNPLSYFLVDAILELGLESDTVETYASNFLYLIKKTVLPWYKLNNNNEYVERERFAVIGKFEDGQFQLKPTEIITKLWIKGQWKNRKTYNGKLNLLLKTMPDHNLISTPVDFNKLKLPYNSRIAIPKGAKLSHFFTDINKAAINYSLILSEDKNLSQSEKTFRKLLISSSLPLLRLSDKKASSQWPYWRPKNYLTSRNAVIVFEDRVKAIISMAHWIKNQVPKYSLSKGFPSSESLSVSVNNLPVQHLPREFKKTDKFKLLLTDPPYSDQAPYLEYSNMWVSILGLGNISKLFPHEIVKSDSPFRLKDTKDYLHRLCEGFDTCCRLVQDKGYVVWFYQDYCLEHWCKLNEIAKNNGMLTVDIIPMPKQRRSIKTVTSPGCTLDGDLLLVFMKSKKKCSNKQNMSIDDILKELKAEALTVKGDNRLFKIYALVISNALKNDSIKTISSHFKDVRKLINNIA